MDTVRYLVAALVVVTVPPVFAGWALVHGFIRTWRRLGPRIAYSVVGSAVILLGVGLYSIREPLLAIEFGGHIWRAALGAMVYAVAVRVEILCWNSLSLRTLVGLPELAPQVHPQPLLQSGIYGRVRHPRYLGIVLGVVAIALAVDYLAVYALVPIFILMVYGITALEERELLGRYGDEYAAYRARVPRLLPRFGAARDMSRSSD